MRLRGAVTVGLLLLLTVAGAKLFSPGNGLPPGTVIFTRIAAGAGAAALDDGGQIVARVPESAGGSLVVLTGRFHRARSPTVSYDARQLLFAAQRREGGYWQIWRMELDGRDVSQVTRDSTNHGEPAYLPGGRIVYSATVEGQDGESGTALYTARHDGTDVQRITFHPYPDRAPAVLSDGRVLFVTRGSTGSHGGEALFTVRYDGTGAELFHENQEGGHLRGRAWETADAEVVFVESESPDAAAGEVIAVSALRPLRSRRVIAGVSKGRFHSMSADPSGALLVSYRETDDTPFTVRWLESGTGELGALIVDDPDHHAVEPVVVAERQPPRSFVSVVDPLKTSGTLYCLDAELFDAPSVDLPGTRNGAVRVFGAGGLLGEIPLEADGSFFVEIPSNTPVRFETVDAGGRTIHGPSAWFWVRPNENRGCIGCHEDRESAPPNRVPMAVEQPPVSLTGPVSATGREGG